MRIEVYHNTGTNFISGYKRGDNLVLIDTVVAEVHGDTDAVLEATYRAYNAVDGTERCVELGVRSLSVGDVISLDGSMYSVEMVGFAPVGA